MNYDPYNQIIYNEIQKQLTPSTPHHFGVDLNVMVLTDRLFGCSDGLCEYLRQYDDITVSQIGSIHEAEIICQEQIPDMFIIVGYLQDKNLYDALKTVKRVNPYACTIIYAMLDEYISDLSFRYKIEFKYSRYEPIIKFIDFLKNTYQFRMLQKEQGMEMVSVEDIPYDPVLEYYKIQIAQIQAQIDKPGWFITMIKNLRTRLSHKQQA